MYQYCNKQYPNLFCWHQVANIQFARGIVNQQDTLWKRCSRIAPSFGFCVIDLPLIVRHYGCGALLCIFHYLVVQLYYSNAINPHMHWCVCAWFPMRYDKLHLQMCHQSKARTKEWFVGWKWDGVLQASISFHFISYSYYVGTWYLRIGAGCGGFVGFFALQPVFGGSNSLNGRSEHTYKVDHWRLPFWRLIFQPEAASNTMRMQCSCQNVKYLE